VEKQTVYLETSIISYATSRPSRDLIVAARQQITREWLGEAKRRYHLFVSQLVIREALAGDEAAAAARTSLLHGISQLAISDMSSILAQRLKSGGAVPVTAAEDALHIAIAAVHGVDFLLTWNFKHIANATMRYSIEHECREAGYEPPIICTPEELIDDEGT
jgi:hypothetical protein